MNEVSKKPRAHKERSLQLTRSALLNKQVLVENLWRKTFHGKSVYENLPFYFYKLNIFSRKTVYESLVHLANGYVVIWINEYTHTHTKKKKKG